MIPLPKDTREVVGNFAEKVENRSLLFEKMVLPKSWGHETKFDEANRYNVLRSSTGGQQLLNEQSEEAQRNSRKSHRREDLKEADQYKARVAGALSICMADNPNLLDSRIQNTLNLLHQLEQTYAGRIETFVATLGGRLLINLSGGVQENAGLALDRCFGLPFIPGSSVKGIARYTALWSIRLEEDKSEQLSKLIQALAIFGFIADDLKENSKKANFAWAVDGDQEILTAARKMLPSGDSFKGAFSFLPAYPTSQNNLAIVAEGITPHTDPKNGKDKSPNVLTFPAVERGSQFGFAVLANRKLDNLDTPNLITTAAEWIREGITEHGVGAKTSSGFGWFIIEPADNEDRHKRQSSQAAKDERESELKRQRAEEKKAEAEKAAAEAERIANLSNEDRLVEEYAKLDDPSFIEKAKAISDLSIEEQTAFFQVLGSSAKKDRRKQWKKKKADLWAQLEATAKENNLPFPS